MIPWQIYGDYLQDKGIDTRLLRTEEPDGITVINANEPVAEYRYGYPNPNAGTGDGIFTGLFGDGIGHGPYGNSHGDGYFTDLGYMFKSFMGDLFSPQDSFNPPW